MSVAHHHEQSGGRIVLFAVLLNDIAQFAELRTKFGDARNDFLTSLKAQGRLVFEGTLGERGCLMIIEAESFAEVLSALQSDPFVVQPISSSVLIRPLAINVLGSTDLLLTNHADADRGGSKTWPETSGIRSLNQK